MSDFNVHATVNDLVNAFRNRGFYVGFSNKEINHMIVRGPNNKGPYDTSVKFNDTLTAKAWLEGYDYATKTKKGNVE